MELEESFCLPKLHSNYADNAILSYIWQKRKNIVSIFYIGISITNDPKTRYIMIKDKQILKPCQEIGWK